MIRRHTYLVGPLWDYRRYCAEHGIRSHNPVVHHVESMLDTEGVADGSVLFLNRWRELPQWRELYNWAIAQRREGS